MSLRSSLARCLTAAAAVVLLPLGAMALTPADGNVAPFGSGALDDLVRAHLQAVDPDPDADQAPFLRPVADLDGDGHADQVQTVVEAPTGEDATTYMFVRSGADGHVLFTDTFDGLLLDVLSSEDGLVANTYSIGRFGGVYGVGEAHGDERPSGLATYAVELDQSTRVLTPAGELTWTYDGPTTSYVYTGTTLAATTEPISRAFALADVDGDQVDDLLMGTYTRQPGDGVVGAPQNDTVTVTAVTADGTELLSASRDISSVEGHIRNAGDVDADGDEDVLLTISTREPEQDGAAVLLSPGQPDREWPIGMNGANTEQVLDGGALLFTRYDGGIAQLLDLRTGTVRSLTEPVRSTSVGSTVHGPIGDSDGDGNGDVALTLREQSDIDIYMTVIVSDIDGEVRRTEFHAPIAEATTAHRGTARSVGDIDGDGVDDIELVYGDDLDGNPTDQHVVSGRTGQTVRDGVVPGTLLHGSVDGAGDDYVVIQRLSDRTQLVTVSDGATDAVRWQRPFHGHGTRTTFVTARGVGDSGTVEVTVRSSTDTAPPTPYTSGLMVDGHVGLHLIAGDGSLLWRVGPEGIGPAVDDVASVSPGEQVRFARQQIVSTEQRNSCLDTQDHDDAACHSIMVILGEDGTLSSRIENVDNPAADVDIYVHRADPDAVRVDEVGRSAGFPVVDGPAEERIDLDLPAGLYIVEFSYYLVPGSSFDEVIELS